MPPSILTATQQRFLESFFEAGGEGFYLSGDTALAAYYLHHRRSDDLDFFTRNDLTLTRADRVVERAASAAGLSIDRVNRTAEAIQYFFSGDIESDHPLVKCELMFDPPPYFADPQSFEGVRVDALLAIAVNKLTIVGRNEPKDYIDRYLIDRSGRYAFADLIALAKDKLVGLDDLTLAAHFKAAQDLPTLAEFQHAYMIADVDLGEMVRFFDEWAERLYDAFG